MSSTLLPLLTFLAVAMGIFAVFSLVSDIFSRDSQKINERLHSEFHSKQLAKAKQSLIYKGSDPFEFDPAAGAMAHRVAWSESLQTMLDQSGLELTKQGLLGWTAGCALGCGLLLGLFIRSPLAGLIAAGMGAVCPVLYVRFQRNKRQEALRRQLSDAFELMARVLRAGQSMQQAMQAVGTELSLPIAGEFIYCAEQQNLGLATEISMRDLAKRTGLIELNIFVVAVLVQRQVGGNLSEILEKLAKVVRDRYKTRGTIKTLTAEGRMQAGVLMALPIFVLVAMLGLNYQYSKSLIEQPYLLGGMAFFMTLGGLWIHKIVNFDF